MGRGKDKKPRKKPIVNPGNNKGAPVGHLNNLGSGHHIAERAIRDIKVHGNRSKALAAIMEGSEDWSLAVRQFRESLITSLGGMDMMNVEAMEILNVILIDKIINDSISSYLLSNPSINRQKKRCFEIVVQRSKLAGDYVSRLRMLRETVKRSKDLTMEDVRASLQDAESDET